MPWSRARRCETQEMISLEMFCEPIARYAQGYSGRLAFANASSNMRSLSLGSFVALGLTLTTAAAAATASPPGGSPADLQAAIQRAIGALTEDGKGWMTARKCASCHHAPFMLW